MRASGGDIDRARAGVYELKEIRDTKDLDQRNGAEPLFSQRDSDQRICDQADTQCERRTYKKYDAENVHEYIVQALDISCELSVAW